MKQVFDAGFRGPLCEVAAWLWLVAHCPIRISVRDLAAAWGWSAPKAQRFIAKLHRMGLADTQTDTGVTVFTVNKSSELALFGASNRYAVDTPQNEPPFDPDDHEDLFGALSPTGSKGSRLADDWRLPRSWGVWAMDQGLSEQEVRSEGRSFRDYWLAKTGKDAVKRDWRATWRNWIRRAAARKSRDDAPGGDGAMEEYRARWGA